MLAAARSICAKHSTCLLGGGRPWEGERRSGVEDPAVSCHHRGGAGRPSELERQDDDVFAWAKRHVTFVALEDEIQARATEILARFPQLVNTRRSRSVADPFVIALARVQGLTVVTAERGSGSPQKPRIPDVCAGVGVKCVPLLGMFKELGWQF